MSGGDPHQTRSDASSSTASAGNSNGRHHPLTRTPTQADASIDFQNTFTIQQLTIGTNSLSNTSQSSPASLFFSSSPDHGPNELNSPFVGSSFIAPSTFDPDSIRRAGGGPNRGLIEIPRGLGFTNLTQFNYRPSASPVAETGEGDEDDDENEERYQDDEDEDEDEDEERDDNAHLYSHTYPNNFTPTINVHRVDIDSPSSLPASGPNSRMPLLANYHPSPSPVMSSTHTNTPSPLRSNFTSPFLLNHRTPINSNIHLQSGGRFTHPFMKESSSLLRHRSGGRGEKKLFGWIPASYFTRRRAIQFLLLIALILSYSTEVVTRKTVSTGLYPYRWFIFQSICFITFIGTTIMTIGHYKDVRHFVKHHGIPYKFLLISSLSDTFHGSTLILAIGFLPARWGLAAMQLTIPFALLFRFFQTNGGRCGQTGVIGSLLIIAGTIIAIIPDMLTFACLKQVTEIEPMRERLLVYLLVLIIGLIPNAASNIYKQSYLQHHSMNIYFMNLVLSGLQLFWTLILGPVALAVEGSSFDPRQMVRRGIGATSTTPPTITDHIGTAIPSTASSTVSPSPTMTLQSSPSDVGEFTLGAGHDLWLNIHQAIQCLSGHQIEAGDECATAYPMRLIQFVVFILSMCTTQYLFIIVMRRVKSERVIAIATTIGLALAMTVVDLTPAMTYLLPSWDIGHCLPSLSSWPTMVGLLFVLFGSVAGEWQSSEEPMNLDVWARLEEFTAAGDLEFIRRTRRLNAAQQAAAANANRTSANASKPVTTQAH